MIERANNSNATRKSTLDDENNDFKKVLESKKNEQKSQVKSKDSQENSDNKVDETKVLKENDKEKNTDKTEDEATIDELNMVIQDLIQTLQSSNMIDGEKLESLIKQIESIIASLDIDGLNMNAALDLSKLKDLLVNLELVSSTELINNEGLKEMIDDKLDKLSQLIKTVDPAFNESNLEANNGEINQNSLNSQSSNDGSTNPNLENQDMTNNSDVEKELSNKEKVNSEGQEKNISTEENSKNQFQVLSKKNISTDPNAVNNNDMDMAAIRNIEVDNSKDIQLFELSKAATNSTAKPDMNIFNQILEGAKLSISEDVSEMFLKLKPDNLGNLSMKISIERGIMVARFDVESQMVKEAIESNLEDLRNALSDKGFEIKEFNVSVNKDSDNQESSFSYFSKKKSKKLALGNNQINNDAYASNHQTIESITSSIDYLG